MTTSQQLDGFLARLQERPDDAATRAVLSDWCDENGRPEAAKWLRETADREPYEWFRRYYWAECSYYDGDKESVVHVRLLWKLNGGMYMNSFGKKGFDYPTRNAALLDLVLACLAMDEPAKCERCQGSGKAQSIVSINNGTRSLRTINKICRFCNGSGKQNASQGGSH